MSVDFVLKMWIFLLLLYIISLCNLIIKKLKQAQQVIELLILISLVYANK